MTCGWLSWNNSCAEQPHSGESKSKFKTLTSKKFFIRELNVIPFLVSQIAPAASSMSTGEVMLERYAANDAGLDDTDVQLTESVFHLLVWTTLTFT